MVLYNTGICPMTSDWYTQVRVTKMRATGLALGTCFQEHSRGKQNELRLSRFYNVGELGQSHWDFFLVCHHYHYLLTLEPYKPSPAPLPSPSVVGASICLSVLIFSYCQYLCVHFGGNKIENNNIF